MADETIASYFQKDHERLDHIFESFQAVKACDAIGAREHFENFRRGLEQHMKWEEEILFPLFESKTGMASGGPTQVMRLEHEQLKKLMKNLGEKMKQEEPGDEEQESALLELLAQHNHKEENILYTMIDQSVVGNERSEVFNKIKGTSSRPASGGCCGHSH
jgi:iron-sulfur cluster repair protein YtfE (RIC family)